MTQSCSYHGCTFGTTGICVLGRGLECPHRQDAADDEDLEVADQAEDEDAPGFMEGGSPADADTAPPLEAPRSSKTPLPLGRQLGFGDLERIGSDRGYRLIGILGAPDAGKTLALVSLYLLAAHRKIGGFEFRNSASLFAFDEIASGARRWDTDGQALEQITEHTELADPRRPGFLHLRLYCEQLGDAVDLVFPDLPGEWTDTLIDRSVHERLGFMRFAHALWVFVDGSALIDPERRQGAVGRVERILSRIRQYLGPGPNVPILLVVTRRDRMDEVPEEPIRRILEEATRREIELKVVGVASFSTRHGMPSGHGLDELLAASLGNSEVVETPPLAPRGPASRQMLMFRSLM